MDISLLTGGRYPTTVFDLDGDGAFTVGDGLSGTPVSGIGGTNGERLTVIRERNGARDFLYGGDGNQVGTGRNDAGPAGRQSWRQLR